MRCDHMVNATRKEALSRRQREIALEKRGKASQRAEVGGAPTAYLRLAGDFSPHFSSL